MSKRNWALIAAAMVSLIYGVSFTIAKDVMPTYVKPFGFILLRVFGATILFWLISFFGHVKTLTRTFVFICDTVTVAIDLLQSS